MPALNAQQSHRTYRFTFIVADHVVCTDEMAEAVYRGGGDDATIGSRDGQVFVHFDRQANSLDEAIVTAAAVLRSAGLRTSRLTIDAEELTDLLAPTTAD